MNLDFSKATPVGEILTDMLKQIIDIHPSYDSNNEYVYWHNDCYPDDLMLAEVSQVFKKKDD